MFRSPIPLLTLGLLIIVIGFARLYLPSILPASNEPMKPVESITQPLVRASDPKRGNTYAPVIIVEFADFSCEACGEFMKTMDAVMKKFPQQVLHVWKDYPLPIHPFARPQHSAARCALEQGRFWEFHDYVLENAPTTEPDHKRIAEKLKLDMTIFADCQKHETVQRAINESIAEGQMLEVNETPTVFINGKRLADTPTVASLTRMIQDLLDQQSK